MGRPRGDQRLRRALDVSEPSNRDREGFPNLVAAGRDAFFNWSPIARNARERNRIYRSFNWGRDADLFILDARSYRSRNNLPDTAENAKTLLGRTQLEWVKQSLRSSRATWKIVSNDVPISITTGSVANGRDGWRTAPTRPGSSASCSTSCATSTGRTSRTSCS